jgi:hypothetical protein
MAKIEREKDSKEATKPNTVPKTYAGLKAVAKEEAKGLGEPFDGYGGKAGFEGG